MVGLGVIRRPWQSLGPRPPCDSWLLGGQRGEVQVCPYLNIEGVGWGNVTSEGGKKGKYCGSKHVREGRMEWWRMMERGDTLAGLAVCKETSAAEEFGCMVLKMNSMSLGFPAWLSPLLHSVTVTLIIMAVYPSCSIGLIIFLFLHLSRFSSLPPPYSPHWLAWTNF